MILKGMQDAGMTVNEDTAKAVLQTVMRLKPSDEQIQKFTELHDMIDEVPKFGNAIDDVDYFARDVAYTYTRPLQKYHKSTWRTVPCRTLSGICECSAGRTDRRYSRWPLCAYSGSRWCFSFCR